MAIDDTPMGLAVHFLEKFSTGASIHNLLKKDAGLRANYDLDVLLDDIMIYWVTRSGTTSFRFYYETIQGIKFLALLW